MVGSIKQRQAEARLDVDRPPGDLQRRISELEGDQEDGAEQELAHPGDDQRAGTDVGERRGRRIGRGEAGRKPQAHQHPERHWQPHQRERRRQREHRRDAQAQEQRGQRPADQPGLGHEEPSSGIMPIVVMANCVIWWIIHGPSAISTNTAASSFGT